MLKMSNNLSSFFASRQGAQTNEPKEGIMNLSSLTIADLERLLQQSLNHLDRVWDEDHNGPVFQAAVADRNCYETMLRIAREKGLDAAIQQYAAANNMNVTKELLLDNIVNQVFLKDHRRHQPTNNSYRLFVVDLKHEIISKIQDCATHEMCINEICEAVRGHVMDLGPTHECYVVHTDLLGGNPRAWTALEFVEEFKNQVTVIGGVQHTIEYIPFLEDKPTAAWFDDGSVAYMSKKIWWGGDPLCVRTDEYVALFKLPSLHGVKETMAVVIVKDADPQESQCQEIFRAWISGQSVSVTDWSVVYRKEGYVEYRKI